PAIDRFPERVGIVWMMRCTPGRRVGSRAPGRMADQQCVASRTANQFREWPVPPVLPAVDPVALEARIAAVLQQPGELRQERAAELVARKPAVAIQKVTIG